MKINQTGALILFRRGLLAPPLCALTPALSNGDNAVRLWFGQGPSWPAHQRGVLLCGFCFCFGFSSGSFVRGCRPIHYR